MNFLVTGGAGFIGSHVCERLLKEGHIVCAFDDLNDFYDPEIKRNNLKKLQSIGDNFEFFKGDITIPEDVKTVFESKQFDQMIHLAAPVQTRLFDHQGIRVECRGSTGNRRREAEGWVRGRK